MLAGCAVIEGGVTEVVEEGSLLECEPGPDCFCVNSWARAAVPDTQSRSVSAIARAAFALILPDFASSSHFIAIPQDALASSTRFEGQGFESSFRLTGGKVRLLLIESTEEGQPG
jgi:hypothetical protein